MIIVHKGKMIFFVCLEIVGCVSTGRAAVGSVDIFADLAAGLRISKFVSRLLEPVEEQSSSRSGLDRLRRGRGTSPEPSPSSSPSPVASRR